ncbi:UvrD-helicase domain-containing protein [Denitratisoma sp. DHT3]|uniref:UvrD-helicase domain-containing protein n=1 Tax=Denitratisoma sp. DHT3 TaxID=1981880 RepID=UPI001C962051|nr:UvrD-helicase domain-containing protein [Denitratisoma sp. DHT3]
MAFHADLHIHSHHSRATSRDLDLEHLAWWAARKGIAVVATGDCVHPAWLAEMKDKLVAEGSGLFALRPEIEAEILKTLPPACRAPVRFMLSTEISTIYKKGERTRKVHHVVYAPDFATVDRLAASLGRIGNIASDGRPILGLDSRDLLEVVLASGPHAYLVPAHIWTPWFSALGSQSGFDSIQECYGDLADHIFAVETGLSSDPEMNWRVSSLDGYRLISNSDAHSPAKLGREATRFDCAPDYFAMRRALETGDGYVGTIEFFPEEGKYHMDGHRACGVCFDPVQTIAHGGRCPVCGKPLTVGVAHRVEALADRKIGTPPPTAGSVTSLVPLPEMLAEILGSGVASQGVARAYDRMSAELGPDFTILGETPVEDVRRVHPLLGEAVDRLRAGRVIRQAGYDGEYGVIRLFEEGELKRLSHGNLLFDLPLPPPLQAAPAPRVVEAPPEPPSPPQAPAPSGHSGLLAALDADQARAASAVDGPLIVAAGPGSGKTRMLTHRLAHLILERGEPTDACLAITFTRRAAEELRERLAALLAADAGECAIHTFHSLGLAFLHAESAAAGLPADFRIADESERAAALAADLEITHAKAMRLLKTVSLLKRTGLPPTDEEAAAALAACRRLGQAGKWVDFDDLVGLPVDILESDPAIAARWRQRFRHICVDEFQDVDARQYRLLQLLAPAAASICAIGDPNQAIYGFRGADAACFARFGKDFPGTRTLRLGRNYRSTGNIVSAAAQVIGNGAPDDITRPPGEPLTLHAAPDERAEAEFVAATIESLLGGHDMLAAGRKGASSGGDRPLDFADFAVLYRTDAQAAALRDALDRAGIPYKKSSPAPIAGQPLVAALLDALARQDAEATLPEPLPARLAAAAEQLRPEQDAAGQAALLEARHWLTALAAGAADETQLREQVALSNEADFWDARADRVSLLTMHAAKGLEFPVVFVVGVEDGLTPFSWGTADRADPEAAAEERRLFYVALTRAKDRLFLTRARERAWRGQRRTPPPSPFLDGIAPELLRTHDAPPRKTRPEQQQYSLCSAPQGCWSTRAPVASGWTPSAYRPVRPAIGSISLNFEHP